MNYFDRLILHVKGVDLSVFMSVCHNISINVPVWIPHEKAASVSCPWLKLNTLDSASFVINQALNIQTLKTVAHRGRLKGNMQASEYMSAKPHFKITRHFLTLNRSGAVLIWLSPVLQKKCSATVYLVERWVSSTPLYNSLNRLFRTTQVIHMFILSTKRIFRSLIVFWRALSPYLLWRYEPKRMYVSNPQPVFMSMEASV